MVLFDILGSRMEYNAEIYGGRNGKCSIPVTKQHVATLLQDLVDIVAQHHPDNIDEIVKYQQHISFLISMLS